jgi:fructose-1,6-bisphosphatase
VKYHIIASDFSSSPVCSFSFTRVSRFLLQKLDVIANDILKRALRFTGRLGVLASEEEETPVSTSSNPWSIS